MAFADVNYQDFQPTQQDEQDKMLLVKFEYRNVQDQAATKAEGRPIFKEKVYIDMKVPGSRNGIVRPASANDKARFQRHYDAFKARIELPSEGTPLAEWPLISRSLAEELTFMNVKTVEQLANLKDSFAGSLMGGNNLKAKAKEWLDRAGNGLTAERLQTELADRDKQLADMQLQLNDLAAQLESRPRKRKSRAKPKVLPPAADDPMRAGDGLPVEGDSELGVHPIIQAAEM
jgi:hypothetical protein